MKRISIIAILASILLSSTVLAGDLRVNILNGTTNTPGTVDRVVLIDLSKGMGELASETDVNGSTTFSDVSSGGQVQYLIQAHTDGVTYSTTLVPSASLSAWEATITVYESSTNPTNLQASVPFFVIYAFEDRLYIQKRLILDNQSQPPVSYTGSPGVAMVHVPENVTEMDYLTFKSGSMPLTTQPISTGDGQFIPNPIKPGTSEIDIAYYLPFESSKAVVSERVNYNIDHFHVYVMPMDMKISGKGLSREGTDQDNGLAIYALENVRAGDVLEFELAGKGMSENEPQQQQQQKRGKIVIEHRLGVNTEYLIAGILLVLIFVSLMISLTQQGADLKDDSIAMLKDQKKNMLKEYASLEESGADPAQKEILLQRLISVYKTLDRIK